LEVEGVLDTQQHLLELETNFAFDNTLILNIHRAVFGELYDWAGKWRTIITNIGIEPGKIPFAVMEYADQVDYLKNNINNQDDLIHCLFFAHHRFTQIHPFNNGNGRTARLVTDLIANMNGYQNIQLYVKESGEERENYKRALAAADNYDESLLKAMIRERLRLF